MNISAILWDYDGTLADGSYKNFMITREIISAVNSSIGTDKWPWALSSFENYKVANHQTTNWRDLYMEYFGLSERQTNEAGPLWSKFQLENKTPVEIIKGIPQLIKNLSSIPQGICSQNCPTNIKKVLEHNKSGHHFSSIVGYNSIPITKQKPDPESFILCLEQMQITVDGTILYIGDHQEDTRFARNAESVLQNNGKKPRILSIAACYSGADPDLWDIQPDYKAYSVDDIISIIKISGMT